jgi:catechol 2,3-dioxygenase-like lactoylglutathione lyase family enzyme
MTTDGFAGFYVETRNYARSAAFWSALGFESVFETDHGSGQWRHPSGGPYVFIAEQLDDPLETHPIIWVADAQAFASSNDLEYAKPFTAEHWGVVEAVVRDPDGRAVSLQGPIPAAGPAAGEGETERGTTG